MHAPIRLGPPLETSPAAAFRLDFRATEDDAWWSVQIRLEGDAALRVMYCGFSAAADELFTADQFRTPAEVDDFGRRFRPTSIQVQDSECELVIEGMEVCASHAFREDDVRFYDAVIEEVNFSKHTRFKEEDVCTCSFVILWQHGPMAGEKTSASIENICFLQSRRLNLDPMLDHFLDMAKKKCDSRNSVLDPTVCLVPSRLGDEFTTCDINSSNTGVACSSGNLGSTVDNHSNKPQLSPCHIEQPEVYDPVWTYCHAFMQPNNLVECSFCGKTYACNVKVKCHLACIGGQIDPCPTVPVYWKLFYSRYITVSGGMAGRKPRDVIAAEIQQDLDAEVLAGRVPLPADRDTVNVGSSCPLSSRMRGSTSSCGIPPVLEHPIEEDKEEMQGAGYKCAVQESTTVTMAEDNRDRRWWEQKLRVRLQKCFKHYGIPHRILQNPDFVGACRHISAAAQAGHNNILPSPQEMDTWILSDSEDEDS